MPGKITGIDRRDAGASDRINYSSAGGVVEAGDVVIEAVSPLYVCQKEDRKDDPYASDDIKPFQYGRVFLG